LFQTGILPIPVGVLNATLLHPTDVGGAVKNSFQLFRAFFEVLVQEKALTCSSAIPAWTAIFEITA
jgi:hypothetical protein